MKQLYNKELVDKFNVALIQLLALQCKQIII